MIFRAFLENGRLNFQKNLVSIYLSKFKDGTVFIVDIRRPQLKHSDPLRRYYFGVVLPTLMIELGYDKDDKLTFHEQLKLLYFDPEPDRHGFRLIPSVFSSKSKIPVNEKIEFVEFVKRKAAEFGVYIKDPNE